MSDNVLVSSLCAVLDRARSLELGLLACRGFTGEQKLVEARLVVASGLRSCDGDMSALGSPRSAGDRTREALLLLSAERYWLRALLDLLAPSTHRPVEVLERALAAFPRHTL